jgi:hypothetical protein
MPHPLYIHSVFLINSESINTPYIFVYFICLIYIFLFSCTVFIFSLYILDIFLLLFYPSCVSLYFTIFLYIFLYVFLNFPVCFSHFSCIFFSTYFRVLDISPLFNRNYMRAYSLCSLLIIFSGIMTIP